MRRQKAKACHNKQAFGIMVRGLVLAIAMMAAASGMAHAESDMLRVFMNQARILKLDRPISKVIIGNDKVADATVADAKTIVLTGRSFGTTNIVLLDRDGNAVLDRRILVSIDEGNTVRVFKQTERTVLSCDPNCEEHSKLVNTANTAASNKTN
ncbi:Flp pilus assembly secretin CpaC [Agrobacterium vitis]|nr:Flp pilus assembly secretin CpaC [Agrobacterium vitis]MBE1437199.1 Flp pilus assembly secretin CpaC [Agrobacterium vitis]